MPDHVTGAVPSLLLDDDEFIATFERGGFGGDAFPHKAHIRMAWLYVVRLGTEAAIERAAEGIRTLAKANGQAALYHDTVTRAWIYLVSEATTTSDSASFEEFLTRNPRLLDKRLLLAHYSPDVLSSAQARVRWIAPDRAPIPGAPESDVTGNETDPAPGVTTTSYLAAFGSVPAAVAVMAASDGVQVHAMTASSVISLSLDPPLVLVCVQRDSRILPMVRASHHFSLSFLNGEQQALARHFASPERAAGTAQFHGVPHRAGQFGVPILDEASAWLACDLWREYPGGDHAIVCGLVREAAGGAAHPLLSYARRLL